MSTELKRARRDAKIPGLELEAKVTLLFQRLERDRENVPESAWQEHAESLIRRTMLDAMEEVRQAQARGLARVIELSRAQPMMKVRQPPIMSKPRAAKAAKSR